MTDTSKLAAEIRAEIEREPGQHFDGPITGAALDAEL